jgi:hypothetical protein
MPRKLCRNTLRKTGGYVDTAFEVHTSTTLHIQHRVSVTPEMSGLVNTYLHFNNELPIFLPTPSLFS